LKERDHFENPGLDVRIILRWIFSKWEGGMDCILLAQEREGWPALVNDVTNRRIT
jgi:hypothetical protein